MTTHLSAVKVRADSLCGSYLYVNTRFLCAGSWRQKEAEAAKRHQLHGARQLERRRRLQRLQADAALPAEQV